MIFRSKHRMFTCLHVPHLAHVAKFIFNLAPIIYKQHTYRMYRMYHVHNAKSNIPSISNKNPEKEKKLLLPANTSSTTT